MSDRKDRHGRLLVVVNHRDHLVLLVRHSSFALETFLSLAGRERIISGDKLINMREKLRETLELIDALAEKND
jgi:hypothetical protein